MSTTAEKRSYVQALTDAEAFRDMFSPGAYESWTFAGSLRRKQPTVGDIEHVIVPKVGERPVPGTMFGETASVNLVWHALDEIMSAKPGLLEKHVYGTSVRWGEKYRGVDFRGFNHELFMADAKNFGSVLAIRTGPAEFSKELVTRLYRKRLHNEGGYVKYVGDGAIYPVFTEQAFFDAASTDWIEPEKRVVP